MPFPIQAATIADTLAGRDVCGRAPTGSGKTLAFGIPLAMSAKRGGPGKPSALILVPTRELATQVADELRPLAEARGRTVATFFGGTTISRDQRRLRQGVDIAIACPGRLTDLVQRRDAKLANVDLVVIDEADRMADMGFLPDVKRLLDQTAADRQTLLFSATLDGDVDVLIRRYQRDPARHEADNEDDHGEVRHHFWRSEPHDRVDVTSSIVRTVDSAIVFTRTKHGADRVARQLSSKGVTSAAIHGNRSQSQRERALADFTAGRVTTLVATDVAARGIHVSNVGMVVHFDPPATGKDYVHRSGRTGRAGADGVVITLVAPDKQRDVQQLQRSLSMPKGVHQVALDQLDQPRPVEIPVKPAQASPSGNRRGGQPRSNNGGPGRPGRNGASRNAGQGHGAPGAGGGNRRAQSRSSRRG